MRKEVGLLTSFSLLTGCCNLALCRVWASGGDVDTAGKFLPSRRTHPDWDLRFPPKPFPPRPSQPLFCCYIPHRTQPENLVLCDFSGLHYVINYKVLYISVPNFFKFIFLWPTKKWAHLECLSSLARMLMKPRELLETELCGLRKTQQKYIS